MWKYSIKLSCLDLKSTPKHRSNIPLPHCTMVRGYGIFHDVYRGLETFWVVGEYLLDTPPKTSIFGHLKIKADQLSCSGDMAGQLTCLKVKAIYLIWKDMCFWKVKVGHLTTLAPDTVSHSDLNSP